MTLAEFLFMWPDGQTFTVQGRHGTATGPGETILNYFGMGLDVLKIRVEVSPSGDRCSVVGTKDITIEVT